MAETENYGCGCGGAPAAPAPKTSPLMAYGCGGASGMQYGAGRFRPRKGIMAPVKPRTKKLEGRKKHRRVVRKCRKGGRRVVKRTR